MPIKAVVLSVEEALRICEHYDIGLGHPTDCIVWHRKPNKDGYATTVWNKRQVLIHRVVCTAAHGECPSSAHLAAHTCRNKNCINPTHLSWKTNQGNVDDRKRDGTNTKLERNATWAGGVTLDFNNRCANGCDNYAQKHSTVCGTCLKKSRAKSRRDANYEINPPKRVCAEEGCFRPTHDHSKCNRCRKRPKIDRT